MNLERLRRVLPGAAAILILVSVGFLPVLFRDRGNPGVTPGPGGSPGSTPPTGGATSSPGRAEASRIEAAIRAYLDALRRRDGDAEIRSTTGVARRWAEFEALRYADDGALFTSVTVDLRIPRVAATAVAGERATADVAATLRTRASGKRATADESHAIAGPMTLRSVEGRWLVEDYARDGTRLSESFIAVEGGDASRGLAVDGVAAWSLPRGFILVVDAFNGHGSGRAVRPGMSGAVLTLPDGHVLRTVAGRPASANTVEIADKTKIRAFMIFERLDRPHPGSWKLEFPVVEADQSESWLARIRLTTR